MGKDLKKNKKKDFDAEEFEAYGQRIFEKILNSDRGRIVRASNGTSFAISEADEALNKKTKN